MRDTLEDEEMRFSVEQIDDMPPDFIREDWDEFNKQFDDNKLLVYGAPEPDDLLGRSAVLGHKSGVAVKEGRYDIAWWIYNHCKRLQLAHAIKCNFDERQILRMDSAASRPMANLLRLEGKHRQALTHMVYCCSGDTMPMSKADIKKLTAYVNRVKLESTTVEDVVEATNAMRISPNFEKAQRLVESWT